MCTVKIKIPPSSYHDSLGEISNEKKMKNDIILSKEQISTNIPI